MNKYKLFKALLECMKYDLVLGMERLEQNMTELQKVVKQIEGD